MILKEVGLADLAEVEKGRVACHLIFFDVPGLGEEGIEHLFLQVDGLLVGINKAVDDPGHPVQVEEGVADDDHQEEDDQEIAGHDPPEDVQAAGESKAGGGRHDLGMLDQSFTHDSLYE